MEFTLDLTLIRDILKDETRQVTLDLTTGAQHAIRQSLARQDERLTAAPDSHTLACKAGCHWCCYFPVDVRAVEAFNIIDFVQQHFSASELEQLRAALARNAAQLRDLDEQQRMQQNLPCPFLCDGQCRIYPVRPQTCRNYHATSAAGCQLSFEQPDNEDIAPEFAPLTYQSGQAHVETFAKVMHNASYDMLAYELNGALDEALRDPAARQRFDERLTAFLDIHGAEAPSELVNLD